MTEQMSGMMAKTRGLLSKTVYYENRFECLIQRAFKYSKQDMCLNVVQKHGMFSLDMYERSKCILHKETCDADLAIYYVLEEIVNLMAGKHSLLQNQDGSSSFDNAAYADLVKSCFSQIGGIYEQFYIEGRAYFRDANAV